jgi:hypothetical protein
VAELQLAKRFDMLEGCGEMPLHAPSVGGTCIFLDCGCLRWVKRRHRLATGLSLLYPQERTSPAESVRSALCCQKQTSRFLIRSSYLRGRAALLPIGVACGAARNTASAAPADVLDFRIEPAALDFQYISRRSLLIGGHLVSAQDFLSGSPLVTLPCRSRRAGRWP